VDKDLTILKSIDGKNLSMEERLALLEQIWNFSLSPASVIRRLLKSESSRNLDKKQKKDVSANTEEENDVSSKNLVIWWEAGLKYKFCKHCIKKKFWKDIVAHINNKWNFTIHKIDCDILKDVNKDRLLPVYVEWEVEEPLIVIVNFLVKNKVWILKDISDILYSMQINIDSIDSKKHSKAETLIKIWLEIVDYDYLIVDRLIDRVKLKLKDLLVSAEIVKIE
jgi:(p)ppGpp synthase/HD superfamily hydrolase